MNNENNFIKLTPFKMQVLQSFPFIDEDFDAITNYELLCKVVDYLNKTVDNVDVLNDEVEEYTNKFNELKDYVDNYFDNLDVQEEVNTKLDEMAESGEITNLISNYMNPFIEQQNNEILSIKTEVESIASGSPAGVYDTLLDLQTADPDHSKIYVVSGTGHWYYYANNQWNDGGVYQSSLSTNVENRLTFRTNTISDTTENVFDIEKLATATDWNLSADGVASGLVSNLASRWTAENKFIDFDGIEENFALKMKVKNNGSITSGRGFTVSVYYTDNTYSGGSVQNTATEWTDLTLTSKTHPTAPIDYILFSVASGASANIWEIKDCIMVLGTRTIPDYTPHFTAKDDIARNQINELDNDIENIRDILNQDRPTIYGIKILNGVVTRTQDAYGLHNDYAIGSTRQIGTNDFDSIFPWSDIKLCNIKSNNNGTEEIYYADDPSFTRDGSNGNVMVEIPKFYTRRYIDSDGADNIEISKIKQSGFYIEPAFIDSVTGEELEKIYVGAYLSSDNGSTLDSKSGTFPICNKSLDQLKQLNGDMYDFVTLQAIQKLIMIEFGAINITPYMGGLSDMVWRSCKAYETKSNTNTAIFGGASYINNLVVGSTIGISDTFGEVQNRTILNINEIATNRREITFDGDPIDVTNEVTYLYSTGQKSGQSDTLTYHTGRVNNIENNTLANQFRYRYIEGLWGNLGEFVDGIIVKRLQAYWTNIKTDYGDISKGKIINWILPEQNTYINQENAKPQQIKKMGLDFHYPTIMLPKELATYDDLYYGDSFFSFYDENQEGHPINPDKEYIGVSSMAWDGKEYNGPFTLRFWIGKNDNGGILYSTRMIKRNLN